MSTASTPIPRETIEAAAKAGSALLRAKNIRKSFRMGDADVEIIKGTDFVVRSGEFIAIEGRSGSGKSTLLHIMGALDAVNAGSIEFDGQDYTVTAPARNRTFIFGWVLKDWLRALAWATLFFIILDPATYFLGVVYQWAIWFFRFGLPLGVLSAISLIACVILHERRERPLADLRNTKFGFVFQFYYLLPELNVLENTMLAPKIGNSWFGFRRRKTELRARATEVLEQLGMGHRLKHRPNQLSGGERQRVAIARALMNDPRVLFADEPTGNLDFETGMQIMGVLEKLHRERGQTIVMVTHDRSIAGKADRVLVLREGRLVSPAEANDLR